jgi:arylsulfatase
LSGSARTSAQASRNSAGKHTVVFDFKSDGPGFGKGGMGVLKVDGKEVANQKAPRTIPFSMTLGETFDVRSDTRTSVDENDYQVPFAFNGKVDKVAVQSNRPDGASDRFQSEIHKDH